MLVAATGLHDVTIPFHIKANYKTYDPEGKAGHEGVYEYTWLDRNHWSAIWSEGGSPIWERWKTDKRIFAPPGQDEFLKYPESLLTGEIFRPFAGVPLPPFLADENFSSLTLSCFRNESIKTGWSSAPQPTHRFCTVKGRPVLRLAETDYYIYFNKSEVFQHRIFAQSINIRDGGKPVLDIDVDQLRSPIKQEEASMEPPKTAVLVQDTSFFLPGGPGRGHLVKREEPRYTELMIQTGVQGSVRLLIEVDIEGKVHILNVLSTSDSALTQPAEDAVSKWQYTPFLRDGKPVPARVTIVVKYALSH